MKFLLIGLLAALSISNTSGYRKPNVRNEVEDIDLLKPLNDATPDDYDSFNVKPLENRDHSSLKSVQFATIKSTMATRPTIRTTTPIPRTIKTKVVGEGQIPVRAGGNGYNGMAYMQSLPRAGRFYEHYPYNKLPRAYQLRPDLYYVYPREFQNAVYRYPYEKLPYSLLTWHQQQQAANNAYNQYASQYYGAYNNQQYQGQSQGGYVPEDASVTEKTVEPKFNDNFEHEDFEKLAAEAAEEKNLEKTATTAKTTESFFDEDIETREPH